jgi:ABC-2 type transport system permease protein
VTAQSDAPRARPRPAPDAPLTSPFAGGGLVDVFRRRYLLKLIVQKEIQSRYQGSLLGLLWSYVQPLVRFCMYFFVIGIVLNLHRDVQFFGIHMFAGIVFVHYFTETFTAGTRSIVRNKSILQKMAMPREMFPVASMLVSAFHILPQLVILTTACLVVGWTPDPAGILAGLMGFGVIALFGTALALLFSAANVFFRDFANVVSTLTIFITWSVPMIYPYSKVDDRFGRFAEFYLLNPIAEAVLLVQRCFWVGATSDPARTIREDLPAHLFGIGFAQLAAGLTLLLFAQVIFSRLEGRFSERL